MEKKFVKDTTQKKISKIEFGVFSEQEIKKLSVLELHERNIYDISGPSRVAAQYGVLDKRLGPTKGLICDTCGQGHQTCVGKCLIPYNAGHFGVVRLVLPVFHVGYFKHMITVLQNICKSCSCVLLEESTRRSFLKRVRNPNIDGVTRTAILKSINTACKKVGVCPHCGDINGAIKKVGAFKIIHEKFKKKKKTEQENEFYALFDLAVGLDATLKPHISKAQEDMTPLVVLQILEKISNEGLRHLIQIVN